MSSAARRYLALLLLLAGGLTLAGCGGSPMGGLDPIMSRVTGEAVEGRQVIGEPYRVGGRWYHPKEDPNYDEVGLASWYGPRFHGKSTANGERFNQHALTAAHPTLPLPSFVRVTALKTKKSVVVRVNDRGPFKRGRIIDVSKAAADELGFRRAGRTKVRVEYLGPAPVGGGDRETRLAAAKYGTQTRDGGRSLADFLPFGDRKDDARDKNDARDNDSKVRTASAAGARGDGSPSARPRAVKVASSAPVSHAARQRTSERAEEGAASEFKPEAPGTESATAFAEEDRAAESAAVSALITLNAEPEAEAEEAGPQGAPRTLPVAERSPREARISGAHDLFAAIDTAAGGAGELRGTGQPE